MTFAIVMPIRSPVKDPGPMPTAIKSMSSKPNSNFLKISWIISVTDSEWATRPVRL